MFIQFILWFALFFSTAFATVYQSSLYVVSDDNNVNGKYVTGIFEGSELYFFLGEKDNAVVFTYDNYPDIVWVAVNNEDHYLHIDKNGTFSANSTKAGTFPSILNIGSNKKQTASLGDYNYYTEMKDGIDPLNMSATTYPLLLYKYVPGSKSIGFQLYCDVQYEKSVTNLILSMSTPVISASADYTQKSLGSKTQLSAWTYLSATQWSTRTTSSTARPATTIQTSSSTPVPRKRTELFLLFLLFIPVIAFICFILYRRKRKMVHTEKIQTVNQTMMSSGEAPPKYTP